MPLFNPTVRTDLLQEPTGTLAYTFPRAYVSTGASVTGLTLTGTVLAKAIGLPAGLTVSTITMLIGATPASGPTHSWAGLTDASLNVLAVSTDKTSTALPANMPMAYAMGTPYVIPTTALYYIVYSTSATTTAPTLAGNGLASGVPNTSSPVICGTAGTQAAPPSLAAQLNSGTVAATTTANFAAWIS